MVYKVEINSTQYFPNGEILNLTEEKYFQENEHNPLSDRQHAFNYLLSFKHEKGKEQSVRLFFDNNCDVYDELCLLTLPPLEEYENEQEARECFDPEFNVENLHKERTSYMDEKYFIGGAPVKLKHHVLDIWDEDDPDALEPLEVQAEILAANKPFFHLSSTFSDE